MEFFAVLPRLTGPLNGEKGGSGGEEEYNAVRSIDNNGRSFVGSVYRSRQQSILSDGSSHCLITIIYAADVINRQLNNPANTTKSIRNH